MVIVTEAIKNPLLGGVHEAPSLPGSCWQPKTGGEGEAFSLAAWPLQSCSCSTHPCLCQQPQCNSVGHENKANENIREIAGKKEFRRSRRGMGCENEQIVYTKESFVYIHTRVQKPHNSFSLPQLRILHTHTHHLLFRCNLEEKHGIFSPMNAYIT